MRTNNIALRIFLSGVADPCWAMYTFLWRWPAAAALALCWTAFSGTRRPIFEANLELIGEVFEEGLNAFDLILLLVILAFAESFHDL